MDEGVERLRLTMRRKRRLMTVVGTAIAVTGMTLFSAWLGGIVGSDAAETSVDAVASHDATPAQELSDMPWVDPATGQILVDKLPALVPVADRHDGHLVGYIKRELLFPYLAGGTTTGGPFQAGSNEPLPVIDEAGNLIGHSYAGVGFVSLEESQAPGFDPEELQSSTESGGPPPTTTPPPGG